MHADQHERLLRQPQTKNWRSRTDRLPLEIRRPRFGRGIQTVGVWAAGASGREMEAANAVVHLALDGRRGVCNHCSWFSVYWRTVEEVHGAIMRPYQYGFFAVVAAFLVAGIGLVALRNKPAAASAHISVEQPNLELGYLPVGQHDAVFSVSNRSSSARRVIGSNAVCVEGCCISPESDKPICVSPGGTVELRYRVNVAKPGPFSVVLSIYFEEDGLRQQNLYVTGIGIEPGSDANGQAKP